MDLSPQLAHDLGIVLNEATLRDIECDLALGTARVVLDVLTLPEVGPVPVDRALELRLAPVGRVVASLRAGLWNQPDAPVLPMTLGTLGEAVRSFGGRAVYGWEFFDLHPTEPEPWMNHLSFDWQGDASAMAHSLTLFQEGDGDRHLDLRLWFRDLELWSLAGVPLNTDDVVDNGRRFWDALYAKDPRTDGFGITPLE